MQHQNKPNRALLETYRNMLDSRLKVRTLLTEKYSNLKGTGVAAFAANELTAQLMIHLQCWR